MELLPAIDLRQGRVVRLVCGEDGERRTYDVDPLQTLLRYAEAGVRRVHVVDLDAAFGEPPQRELIARLAGHPGAPRLELGGGLRDRDAVAWAFAAGVERAEAAIRAARERLAPILMTAVTAALGLLPLALALGQPGSEIQAPMALVILTGLASSTLLNMLVVPTLIARWG